MASGELSLVKQRELIDLRCNQLLALQAISSALQSTFDLPQLLDLIVDCAKQITQVQKAVLQLIDEKHEVFRLDSSKIVVRGCRSEHPESWWRKQLDEVAHQVVEKGKPVMISPGQNRKDKASSMICVPLKIRNKSVGVLSALNPYPSPLDEQDVTLLIILAGQAAIAIENAKLFARNQQLAVAGERKRIANELHDGIAQSIYNVVLSLQVCERLVSSGDQDVISRIRRSQELARKSLEDVRQCVYNLRPSGLETKELASACKQYVKSITRIGSLSISFTTSGPKRNLCLNIEKTLYRLLQEGVMNIIKHAQATEAEVTLRYQKRQVGLIVKDNGKGFNAFRALTRAERKGKMGLVSMKQRVKKLNGKFVVSSQPGLGTELKAEIPI